MTLTYYSPGFARCCLDGANLIANLYSCLGGLRGKALDFLATMAKPPPTSPARAASIVAFNASGLVYRAIMAINWTTLLIRSSAAAGPAVH